MNVYLLLKLLHIIAVIMFLGNIVIGAFWMQAADKTKDPAIISFTMKAIIASDKLFTLPGVLIIIAGGVGAAMHGGLPMLRTGWIFWSIILFAISGIIFGAKLAPLQKKILQLTENSKAGTFELDAYQKYLREWQRWGLLSTATPVIALVMMVLKIPAHSGF